MADVMLAPGSIKSLKDCYAGIGGVKPIKEIYIGVGNQPVLVWPSGTDYGEGGEVSWAGGDTIFTNKIYGCYPSWADPDGNKYLIDSASISSSRSSVCIHYDYDKYYQGSTKTSGTDKTTKLGNEDNPYTIWVPTNLQTIDLTLYDYVVLTGYSSSEGTSRAAEIVPMFSTCDDLGNANRYIKYDSNCSTGSAMRCGRPENGGQYGYYNIQFWIVADISQASIKDVCAKIGFSFRLIWSAANGRLSTGVYINSPITMYTAEAFAESKYSEDYNGANGGKATVTFKG